MEFINHTPFPSLAFPSLVDSRDSCQVVVLRQTCTLVGGRAVFSDEQSPLCEEDKPADPLHPSSILAESDFCRFKPRCDVILDAAAHAPGGRPARSFPVRLQLWQADSDRPASGRYLIDKTLRISGPVRFRPRRFPFRWFWFLVRLATLGLIHRNPWKRTRPDRIASLPIRYEHAYGGETKVLVSHTGASRIRKRHWRPGVTRKQLREKYRATGVADPLAWAVDDANPVGEGFSQAWYLEATRARSVPAPQIEAPEDPVTARRFYRRLRGRDLDHPAFVPRGFGILAKAWLPRRRLAGTMDAAWIRSGQPLPGDLDDGFWNGAPPDQQPGFLRGDETLVLTNLCRPDAPGATRDADGNTRLLVSLPGHRPFLLLRLDSGPLMTFDLVLDTLVLAPDPGSLVLVWRAVLPEPAGIRVAEAAMLDPAGLARFGSPEGWLRHERRRMREALETGGREPVGEVAHG